jgi:protocatechuate 3,4-dioxygenase beta subunit
MQLPDHHNTDRHISRRGFLHGALALGAAAIIGACRDDNGSRSDQAAPGTTLAPTPSCTDGDDPTPAQTEGPYFTPNSPERMSLLDGASSGTRLVLTGSVVDTSCRPMARALLDFWQADAQGNYDNSGYRFRGHLFADGDGRFRLETVVPGLYPGRTRHIHVKVQPPGGAVLTTQLYFPGEPRNASDGIFRSACLMDVQDGPEGKTAGFRFVLAS